MTWELHNAECREALEAIDDDAIGHIVCDPPYDEQTHTKQRAVYSDGPRDIESLNFVPLNVESRIAYCFEMVRVCRGWLVATCELEGLGEWKRAIEYTGGQWIRAGIWRRKGAPQITGDRPAQAAEGVAIAYCGKGRKVWNRGGGDAFWDYPNVWMGERVGRKDALHPSQKPVDLMEAFVRDFTQRGDWVCDPFAGSGTTGVACIRQGRNFLGFERDEGYAEKAFGRLQKTKEQPGLFDKAPKPKQSKLLL